MSGKTAYAFASVSFTRDLESERFYPWAFPESQYTADPVLGPAGRSYLDIGGDTVGVLNMVGSCASAADRQTLKLARNTTGVLSNTRGRSNTYTLVKATPVDDMPYAKYLIELSFILRPS